MSHGSHMNRSLKWMIGALTAIGLAIGALFTLTPQIYVEAFIASLQNNSNILPPPVAPGRFDARAGPPLGTVIDHYWRVQPIAPGTYAIGEPQDDPDNYEYLLIGRTRALLIDAGQTRTHDIHVVLNGLTRLPVTAIPSHLHWDHTDGLTFFNSIALVDLPETRGRDHDGFVQLTRHEFVNNKPLRFKVSEWVEPDTWIDLGGRHVQLLSTPGHTATSISIYDPSIHALFTGDYIYPTTLYAFLPDSSLSAYVSTADRLLKRLPPDTKLYGAHCCRNDVVAQAPWLSLDDLRDARAAIKAVQSGHARGGRGVIIRRYPVNSRMTMLTLYPFGNR